MTIETIHLTPIEGPAYDPLKPETKQAWLDFRREGITATQIRDWGIASRRRKIIEEKVTGQFEDLSHIAAVSHGTLREPAIADWIKRRFGIEPCDSVFASPTNSRHLASPDGVTRDPFTGELTVGPAAALSEIKTSKHNLVPGRLDASRNLVEIDYSSDFARSNYYTQMQWQMAVMGAGLTLFAWEQHDNIIDPETGTFTPLGAPEWCWIPRDENLIQVLLTTVAPDALRTIDEARAAITVTDLPPVSAVDSERAILIADLVKARQAEALAKAAKEQAWAKLQAFYLAEGTEDLDKVDAGVAYVTVSTSSSIKNTPDMDAARKRAPKLVANYEALVKRYTKPVTTTTRRLTITEKKAE
jgi:hypothetical protein